MTSKAKAEKWLANSKRATINNSNEVLSLEIEKRIALVNHFPLNPINSATIKENINGVYNIIGFNQNDSGESYSGFLTLQKTNENRIIAEWVINNEQVQMGKGFFKDDLLVINFFYEGESEYIGKKFKGIVVYTFITDTILSGFWSEKHGDDNYIGLEEGRKMNNAELLSSSLNLN